MSMQTLQSLHSRLQDQSTSGHTASHVDICVFASLDGRQFHSFPPTLSTNKLETVLPSLRTKLAVQASSPMICDTIKRAAWPQDEVHLDYSNSLPIVNTEEHLMRFTNSITSAALTRSDPGSLVLWGGSEAQILYHFQQILSSIHRRYETTIPNTVPFPAPSGGVDLEWPWFDNLPPLDEFSSLTTVPGPMAPTLTNVPQAYADASLLPTGISGSPGLGGLQLALHPSSTSSPSSDTSAFSFVDPPSWTHFMDNSLNPAFLTNFGGVEGETWELSFFSASSSDGVASPVLSASSGSTTSQEPPLPAPATATATGTSSFRRHSVGEANAPLSYAPSRKTKRALTEDSDYVPKVNIKGESLDDHADVNQHTALDVRAPKRLRPIPTPISAPALLTALPTIDHAPQEKATADNSSISEGSKLDRTSPAPAPATATTTLRRGPAPQSTRSSSSSKSGSSTHPTRRTRRRTATTRTKRTPCDYCSKTFSRVQDAQRHITTSCTANPDKMGVQCPECGSVLSRLDAAQRHWRGHENPSCEAPEWALRA